MPGRLILTRPAAEVAAFLGVAVPDLVPRLTIAPGEQVLCRAAGGAELARWGLIPVGRVNARKRPVMETIHNARSETLFAKTAFAGVGRAILPVDGWVDWTAGPGRRQAWRFRAVDGGCLAFAAIRDVWTAPGGPVLAQIATVTCAPNEEVAPHHDRMAVILAPADFDLWLGGSEAEVTPLMRPWPAGRVVAERATEMDGARG